MWSIKEEEAYQKVISKVMSALEKNGIGAVLLYDENDPRIDQVGTIMYVKYSEAGETRHTPVNRAPSMGQKVAEKVGSHIRRLLSSEKNSLQQKIVDFLHYRMK